MSIEIFIDNLEAHLEKEAFGWRDIATGAFLGPILGTAVNLGKKELGVNPGETFSQGVNRQLDAQRQRTIDEARKAVQDEVASLSEGDLPEELGGRLTVGAIRRARQEIDPYINKIKGLADKYGNIALGGGSMLGALLLFMMMRNRGQQQPAQPVQQVQPLQPQGIYAPGLVQQQSMQPVTQQYVGPYGYY